MIQEEQLVTLGPWKGVNNTDKEQSIGQDELRSAINVDFDRSGDPRLRPGYSSVETFTNGRSVYSNGNMLLVCDGSTLYYFGSQDSIGSGGTTLRSDLDPEKEVSYTDVLGTVYWTNGVQSGRVLANGTAALTSVSTPSGPTVTATTGGNLYAGDYQVCLTQIDEYGEESGSTLASVVTVPANGVITVSDMIDTGASGFYRIYATPANGDDFFRHAEIPIGTTSFSLATTVRGPRLETQFLEPLPPGQIIRYYRGRLYVAYGSVVWFSEPLRYGLWSPIKGYLPEFAERITVMEPVHDGIYIVADKAYFMRGTDPNQFVPEVAHAHRADEGSGTQVPAKMFGSNEAIGNLAYWFGDNGPCVGYPGGVVNPPAEDKVAFDEYQRGASLFREEEGIRTVTTSLRGKGASSGFAASDSLTFTVRRNGVVVS